MLSKDHLELSIFSSIILFGWLIFQNLIVFIAIISGVFIGCLLPDTDIPRSKIDYLEGIAGFFGMISKKIINPLVILIFNFLKYPVTQSHRGITHTFYGVLTYCIVLEIISIPVFVLFGFSEYLIGYSFFVFGLFFGGMLHIVEDSCTQTGVFPFYPVNQKKKYSGNISTYNFKDPRPKFFSLFLIFAAGGVFFSQIFWKNPIEIYIFISFAVFIISWIVIILISKK
jgi:inner membrane protein